MITALGGGVGAAKFLEGLSSVIGDESLNVIVNTGDDINLYGLNISPDVDTVIYRLSGSIDKTKGWGIGDDTFHTLKTLERFGEETWFNIGDKDFATHLYRTYLKKSGLSPTDITSRIAGAYGVKGNIKILPMTDQDVETWIVTDEGEMHFQEYLVKRRMRPEVIKVIVKNIERAEPAPGVISSIENSRGIILCPSNPIISIGPILNIDGIKKALKTTHAKIVAISPLIKGAPLKGPADKLMKGIGLEVSSVQVARLYRDFLDIMVIDTKDSPEAGQILDMGVEPLVVDTLMSDPDKAASLASSVLGQL
ncbi:MAG: 2-phospho-L-lactate transferase [Deltaproteobacteria bacterium]